MKNKNTFPSYRGIFFFFFFVGFFLFWLSASFHAEFLLGEAMDTITRQKEKKAANLAPNEILVKFRVQSVGGDSKATLYNPSIERVRECLEEIDRMYKIKLMEKVPTYTRDTFQLLSKHTYRFSVERNLDPKKIAEKIEKEYPDVIESAEPNYRVSLFRAVNDPYYSEQWHLPIINADNAWDRSFGGKSTVKIAILDTGIAYENYKEYKAAPDLKGVRFIEPKDIANKDSHPNDDNGHGTHITGIIAQSTDNNQGTAGIAFKASIIPVKILDAHGNGTISDVISGINYARSRNVNIINLSLGTDVDSRALHNAVKDAYREGILIVAASGNTQSEVAYPARYPEVMAVGATKLEQNQIAEYSNTGLNLSVVAPGGTLEKDTNGDGNVDGILSHTFVNRFDNFTYTYREGTSFAAPQVTGIAALMLSFGIDKWDVRNYLEATAKDLGSHGFDPVYGYGLIDAESAINRKANPSPKIDSIVPNTIKNGGETAISIRGKYFLPDAEVKIAGKKAKSVNVVTSTWITAKTPKLKDVLASVEVKNPGGRSIFIPHGIIFTSKNTR